MNGRAWQWSARRICSPQLCIVYVMIAIPGWYVGSRLLRDTQAEASSSGAIIDQTGVHCEACEHDLGEIDPATSQDTIHRFAITNSLAEDVLIDSVRVDCGCLGIEDYPETIPAGGSVAIAFRYRAGLSGGPFRQTAHVMLSGPLDDVVRFTISGTINPLALPRDLLKCLPEKIEFGIVASGESKQRSIQLYRIDGRAIGEVEITCIPPVPGVTFAVEALDVPAAEGVATLRAVARNDRPLTALSREFNAVLHVVSRTSERAEIAVPLRLTLDGIDRYFRRSMTIMVNDSQPQATSCLLRSDAPRGAVPIVKSVRYAGDAGIDVSVAPLGAASGNRYPQVTVSVVADGASPAREIYRGALYITTAAESREILVPLLVRVAVDGAREPIEVSPF